MLGRRNIRDSIGYVTLGLFTHALLEELLEARKRPEVRPDRHKMITIASQSLKAIRSPAEVDSSHWRDLVFQNYQESRTLHAVLGPYAGIDDLDELERLLDGILEAGTKKNKRLRDIEKAMRFFEELARIAVINAERPEERVPSGVRQLVGRRNPR
jgi:hypothetical protein